MNQELLKTSKSNDLEMAEQAIKNGANINAKDKKGRTALHEAAWNGNEMVIQKGCFI